MRFNILYTYLFVYGPSGEFDEQNCQIFKLLDYVLKRPRVYFSNTFAAGPYDRKYTMHI